MLPPFILQLYHTIAAEAKMKSVIFILLLAIGGSMGGLLDFCNVGSCHGILTRDHLEELGGLPPLEEHLKTMCRPALESLDCVSDLVPECTGQSLEALETSDNETISMAVMILSSANALLKDICDEDSTLHKNYVSGISCFRNKIRDTAHDCYFEADRIYSAYRETSLELGEVDDDDEAECMLVGYGIACFSKQLRKDCGVTASDTFLEIVRRLKFLKFSFCKPKDLLTLKTKFLDYLEEQGEQRDIFASAFDFRRRK